MSVFGKIRNSFIATLLKKMFRIEIVGSENEPKEGPYIVCANHTSNYDPIVTALGVTQPIFYMAKAELFKIPVLRSIIKAFGAYPVDRKRSADVSSIKNTLAILKNNGIVGMYPNGTRAKGIPPDQLKPKSGFAMIALKAQVGVLPMTIITKNNKVKLFKKTKIVLGEFVPFEENEKTERNEKSERMKELTDKVFGKIVENYNKYKF